MNHWGRIGCGVAVLFFFVACGQSDSPAPSPQPSVQKTAGQEIFEQKCAYCHGMTGRGDGPAAAGLPKKPANLASSEVQRQSDSELAKKVGEGKPPLMPAWKEQLTPEQIREVVKYLRTFRTS